MVLHELLSYSLIHLKYYKTKSLKGLIHLYQSLELNYTKDLYLKKESIQPQPVQIIFCGYID